MGIYTVFTQVNTLHPGFYVFPTQIAERSKWAWPDDVTLQFKVDWR